MDAERQIKNYTAKARMLNIRVRFETEKAGGITLQSVEGENLKSYEVPAFVTAVAGNAFALSRQLSELSFPDSVREIHPDALRGLSRLKKLRLPEGLKRLCERQLENCAELEEFSLPSAIQKIGEGAFLNCRRLRRISFPKSVDYLGRSAFSGCISLSEVSIPEKVRVIMPHTFFSCQNLARVELTPGLISIGYGAFENCRSLVAVQIPDGVRDIGSAAFMNCTSLQQITFGTGVSYIGSMAFSGCVRLTDIRLPGSVSLIHTKAFQNCRSLTGLSIGGESAGGEMLPLEIGDGAFAGCPILKDVDLPGRTKIVRPTAFAGEGSKAMTGGGFPEMAGAAFAKDHVRRRRISGSRVPDERSRKKHLTAEGYTVEQLIAASILDIKNLFPFMYAALAVIPRVESDEVESIAVSGTRLYYNGRFIEGLVRPVLTFHLIHAVYHILMKHHARGRGKDPILWNIACDLYINKSISEAFDISPIDGVRLCSGPDGAKARMRMPDKTLYSEDISLERDTPEILYLLLAKEKEHDIREMESNDGKNKQKGKDKSTEGDNKGGQIGASGEVSSRGEGDLPEDADEKRSSRDTEKRQQKEQHPEEEISGTGKFEAPDLTEEPDIIEDRESDCDSEAGRNQKTESLLSKIEIVYRQMMRTYVRGKGEDPLGEALLKENAPKTDWRVLLQNRLVALISDEKDLSHPDRRFAYRGLYIEGPAKTEDQLTDIKICVDTSASMRIEDVSRALQMIEQLLSQYRMKADLVFWDEEIEHTQPFENTHELHLASRLAKGGGGTNPNCLFEAFSPGNARGHTDPKPVLLIIFTDGWFDRPKESYRRLFGRDTIWILCAKDAKPAAGFNPGFGKTAILRN